jgi:hypothetical protein
MFKADCQHLWFLAGLSPFVMVRLGRKYPLARRGPGPLFLRSGAVGVQALAPAQKIEAIFPANGHPALTRAKPEEVVVRVDLGYALRGGKVDKFVQVRSNRHRNWCVITRDGAVRVKPATGRIYELGLGSPQDGDFACIAIRQKNVRLICVLQNLLHTPITKISCRAQCQFVVYAGIDGPALPVDRDAFAFSP